MRNGIFMSFVCAALLGGAACRNERSDRDDINEAQRKVTDERQDVAEAKGELSDERAEYKAKLKTRLDDMDRKLDELERRGDERSKETAAKLRIRRDELSAKMDRAGDKADGNWEEFKKDVGGAFDSLEKDIRDTF